MDRFRLSVAVVSASIFVLCGVAEARAENVSQPKLGTVEIYSELEITPGNVTASRKGRMFASIHGQRRGGGAQLVEVFPGQNKFKPFPNVAWNAEPGSGPNVLNTAHGVLIDDRDWLWVIDHGNWMPAGKSSQPPKLVAFDIQTGELRYRLDFDVAMFPRGQILQDLAVDSRNGFVYIADCGAEPGIVVVNTTTKAVRKVAGHPSFNSEASAGVKLVVEGKELVFPQPGGRYAAANVPINPITLSADGETLYWGAMVGTKLYAASAKAFREGAPVNAIAETIRIVGDKPVSDGFSTDENGNHFITNLGENGIDRLSADGRLTPFVRDARFIWPDSVRFGEAGWLYIAVNQLNRAAIFTGAGDSGVPPYLIARVWTGTKGQPGR